MRWETLFHPSTPWNLSWPSTCSCCKTVFSFCFNETIIMTDARTGECVHSSPQMKVSAHTDFSLPHFSSFSFLWFWREVRFSRDMCRAMKKKSLLFKAYDSSSRKGRCWTCEHSRSRPVRKWQLRYRKRIRKTINQLNYYFFFKKNPEE